MLGKLISMVAGRSLARNIGGTAAGPVGMVAGALLPTVMRRLGPGGMIAAAVGGYAVKKMMAKRQAAETYTPPRS